VTCLYRGVGVRGSCPRAIWRGARAKLAAASEQGRPATCRYPNAANMIAVIRSIISSRGSMTSTLIR
jgi:hypothetical protein